MHNVSCMHRASLWRSLPMHQSQNGRGAGGLYPRSAWLQHHLWPRVTEHAAQRNLLAEHLDFLQTLAGSPCFSPLSTRRCARWGWFVLVFAFQIGDQILKPYFTHQSNHKNGNSVVRGAVFFFYGIVKPIVACETRNGFATASNFCADPLRTRCDSCSRSLPPCLLAVSEWVLRLLWRMIPFPGGILVSLQRHDRVSGTRKQGRC